jgi:hypothetical protein
MATRIFLAMGSLLITYDYQQSSPQSGLPVLAIFGLRGET